MASGNTIRTGLILTLIAIGTNLGVANAIDGVRKATLEVGGKTYAFPITPEREMDIFWLKKAAAGDKEALSMFLGQSKERVFFIGDDTPLWLRVTDENGKAKMEIV